jgi:hypothetical protein
MPRRLTPTIRAVLDAGYAQTHDIMDITLPATGALSSVTLHCGGSKGLTVDGNLYLPVLRSINQIKMSLGGNSDMAEATLENVSRTFGAVLADTERPLDGATVVIKRAFLIDENTDTYESVIIFNGVIQNVKVDQNLVTLSILSDMNKRNAKLGNKQITQKCLAVFNVNGSGVGPECGWRSGGPGNPTDQVGDPLNCNKVFDSPDGCLGHANQHRFIGVPFLKPKDLPPQTGDDNGGYDDWDRPSHRIDPDYHPWINPNNILSA